MARQIINKRGLRKLVPFSDATFWRLEQAGKFPKRIQLTEGGAVGWYLDEIEEWIEARVRGGGKAPPSRRAAGGDDSTSVAVA